MPHTTPHSGDGPSLSIVIPHYGDPAHAGQLLETLRGQLGAGDQVIVVDDASPRPFPGPTVDDPRVLVRRRERNGGFAAAVNTGTAAAHGDVLAVLNSDLQVPSDFLEDLRAAHRRHRDALVVPAVIGPSGTVSWACRRFPTVRGQALQHLRVVTGLQYRRCYQVACGMDLAQWRQGEQPTEAEWIAGVVLSLPREILNGVGGLCEEYHMYVEETDLQRRLADHGIARIHDPSFRVAHAEGASSDPAKAAAWEMRSRFVYARRWGNPLALALALTAVTLVNLPLDAIRRARGKDVRPLAAARDQMRRVWSAWALTRTVRRAAAADRRGRTVAWRRPRRAR